jgi:deoxyribose-phosphate aldolase
MPTPDAEPIADALRRLADALPPGDVTYVDEALERIEPPRRPGLAGPGEAPDLTPAEIAGMIDHTQLRPEATDEDVDRCCREALEHGFASVCVAPSYVARADRALAGSGVVPCTVIGFPHGANHTDTKAFEARRALQDGARELDMVVDVGAVRSRRYADAAAGVRRVVETAAEAAAADEERAPVKVILETALLSPAEIAVSCVLATEAGADFVKTSTGFAEHGARPEDVALMRQMVDDDVGVKASGGVGSAKDVRAMAAHGATRIGASGSVDIMRSAVAAGSA